LTEDVVYRFEGQLSPEDKALEDELMALQTLEGRLEYIEQSCAAVLAKNGLPECQGNYLVDAAGHWEVEQLPWGGRTYTHSVWSIAERRGHAPDDPVGFAARMVDYVALLRERRASGSYDNAMMMALFLGVNWARSGLKEKHQAVWDTGHAQRKYLGEQREITNRLRHDDRAAEWTRWNQEAAQVWGRNSALSKFAVAERVKRNLGLPDSIRTIRDRLKKVGEAG
jgi:hypothetical protein